MNQNSAYHFDDSIEQPPAQSDSAGSFVDPEGRRPILPLSRDVAERIAAGEVIERPVSVVKELLENALDAGAHDIRIEVRGGGLRLIRVSDDGQGVPAAELERALARHTTSKIRSTEDLGHLITLGFRGEALASIASVSELTLLSRAIETVGPQTEQPAAFVRMRGGEVLERGGRARTHGTTVTVRDLFYNVPARLKFMRGARTEAGHILQLVRRYALGYPSTRFHLDVEEQTVLQTGGSGKLATALAEIYQLPLIELLHPLAYNLDVEANAAVIMPAVRLQGYIGNRALAQNNRQHITLFVNGRWVQSRRLQAALEAGYRALLPKGKHPLLVVRLEVPPEQLDANVHPAKTEVSLLQEDLVARTLTEVVHIALGQSPALPQDAPLGGPKLVYQRSLPGPRRRGLHLSETVEPYQAGEVPPPLPEILKRLKPLAQLQEALILAEAPDGSLYLVDQHRAHERVIYEQLRKSSDGRTKDSIERSAHLLLEPAIVELKRHEAELFEQRLPLLQTLGLECERFGGRSFLIRSVPLELGEGRLVEHLDELATLAAEDSDEWEDRLLTQIACRSALRRGYILGQSDQQKLLSDLAEVDVPAVCPHGSPILLHYSRDFLIEKFDW